MLRFSDLNLDGKRILIREDFNVPLDKHGHITSDSRLRAAIPTLQMALKASGAQVIVLSHLGRPQEGIADPKFSLAPVAKHLSKLLKQPVRLVTDWINGVTFQSNENIVLCENVRFQLGEKKNDPSLAKKMAALGDIFVMDAFATAHRAEASTAGIASFAQIACAGPLLCKELNALQKAFVQPKKPLVAIISGAKISTKWEVLTALAQKVDVLLIGGGMANTLLAAAGYAIGKSLYEKDLLGEAKKFLSKIQTSSVKILLPVDTVVATRFAADATPSMKAVNAITDDDIILDIGSNTIALWIKAIQSAGTVIWNGPPGVFEWPTFSTGTYAIAIAIAESAAFSLAGGGDTIAALEYCGVTDKIGYISTGGGAFLEFLEGKPLPAVVALER